MAPAPTLVSYYLLCLGRQSSSLKYPYAKSTITRIFFNDGAPTRLALGALLTTRDCGNKCSGTNFFRNGWSMFFLPGTLLNQDLHLSGADTLNTHL